MTACGKRLGLALILAWCHLSGLAQPLTPRQTLMANSPAQRGQCERRLKDGVTDWCLIVCLFLLTCDVCSDHRSA